MATTLTKSWPSGMLQSSVELDEVTLSAGITTGSAQFSGSNYLTVPNNVALNPGTGNFTIEFWVKLNSTTNNASFWRGNNNGVDIFMNGTGKLALGQAQVSTLITDSVNMTTGSWVHVAAVKNGSTITLYKNGVSVGSSGSAPNFVTDTINYIGNQGSYRINGYMTNLRVVIGSAVYTAAFTPPTRPLTAIAGTQFLLLEDTSANLLKDSSANNITVTNIGSVTWSATSPLFASSTAIRYGPDGVYAYEFDEVSSPTISPTNLTPVAERKFPNGVYQVQDYFDEVTLMPAATGSILFNATPTQWLSIPNNTAFNQTGGFTIECWFRPTSTGTGYIWAMLQHNFLTCKWIGGQFQIDKSYVGNPTGYAPVGRTYGINTWYHIAMSSNGSSGTLFINGVVEATFTDAGGTVADGNPFYIGQYQGQGQPTPQGYISNFRVVKGTAVYTSAFTPPTTALTAITNTQLLLNTTYDANFLKDNSSNNFTITNNGSVTSSSLAPF